MYVYLHRNSKNWTFYSVKNLKCESFLIALQRNSEKGRLAPMWQQSGTLLFCSCHGIARLLVDELLI